jgi:regulator of protease activity HflC (stomatin/prohibitin superfamily)
VQPIPLPEGVHFIRPFFLSSVVKIDARLRTVKAKASSSSRDLQAVAAGVSVQYSLVGSLAPLIVQRFGNEMALEEGTLHPAIQESIKSVSSQYTAEELITKRAAVKLGVEEAISEFVEKTLKDKGVDGALRLANVAITDFEFSPEFNIAIEAKVRAEQEALKAENEKKTRITQAEAAAAEKRLNADAAAFKITAESKARADAIERESKALKSNPELVQLRIAEKWDGKLPTYTGNKLPLLNIK